MKTAEFSSPKLTMKNKGKLKCQIIGYLICKSENNPYRASLLSVSLTEASDLSPLAVVDDGAAAGDPADGAVLQLQLQLPMVHCKHNPGAV